MKKVLHGHWQQMRSGAWSSELLGERHMVGKSVGNRQLHLDASVQCVVSPLCSSSRPRPSGSHFIAYCALQSSARSKCCAKGRGGPQPAPPPASISGTPKGPKHTHQLLHAAPPACAAAPHSAATKEADRSIMDSIAALLSIVSFEAVLGTVIALLLHLQLLPYGVVESVSAAPWAME